MEAMEPVPLSMVIAPHDIVLDLIRRRVAQIEEAHPGYSEQMTQLEQKLQAHSLSLKNCKDPLEEALQRNILQSIELK